MTSFDFRPKSGHGGNISDGFPQEIIKVSHLQNLIRANDAKNLLYRAGKAVGPLLQRRKWKIYHLTEFYPNNSSLHGLNVNQGQVIKIRLRTPER